ncbi:hypothetical protein Bhyg_12262, partial [Pseudolycoriella hygida]
MGVDLFLQKHLDCLMGQMKTLSTNHYASLAIEEECNDEADENCNKNSESSINEEAESSCNKLLKANAVPHLKLPTTTLQRLSAPKKEGRVLKRQVVDQVDQVVDIPMELSEVEMELQTNEKSCQTMELEFEEKCCQTMESCADIDTQTPKVSTETHATQTITQRHINFQSLSDNDIIYLTGLDRARFEVVFQMLEKFNPISDNNKFCRREAFVLMLFKIRHNLAYKMMEFIFKVDRQDISASFKEVTEKLYDVLRQ